MWASFEASVISTYSFMHLRTFKEHLLRSKLRDGTGEEPSLVSDGKELTEGGRQLSTV